MSPKKFRTIINPDFWEDFYLHMVLLKHGCLKPRVLAFLGSHVSHLSGVCVCVCGGGGGG